MHTLRLIMTDLRTSGFRTLGTSLSRPFSSIRASSSPGTPAPQAKEVPAQRELKEMNGGLLSGTQSREIRSISLLSSSRHARKIRRVESRFLEINPEDVKVGDVASLLCELRRVVGALDELGGFIDA